MEEVKWCFVPTCLNSTRNTVNKWFVPIPVNPKRREIWFKAVNRNYCFNSERSTLYCCSDHFNLNEDAGSFFERNGEIVVKLKKSIVPRIQQRAAENTKPVAKTSSRKTILLEAKNDPSPSPSLQLCQSSSNEVVSLVDGTSSDEDDQLDVVGIVTSETSNARKTLLEQKGQAGNNLLVKLLENPSGSKQPKTKPTTGRSPKIKQAPNSSPTMKHAILNGEAMKSLFDSLRKSIPSIASHQALTREQILDKAVEFIVQMRNKSDRRQCSMQYVMENNGTLTAKIQYLEHLISLHEKNEIVLTKEIVDRRLGAVSASRPATLALRLNKQKTKR